MKNLADCRVLLVDDAKTNLDILVEGLKSDHKLSLALNGEMALQIAARTPPDLVLLDIVMPGMDGYEVCRRLKATASLADVPVIFLTALSETADKVTAFEAGGVDYVTKPFQFDEVLARVNTHLALRRTRQALQDNYERLWALEQLRDDLVRMIVQDFRSPLTLLCGHLQLVAGDAGVLSERTARSLATAVDAAETIRRMANDLLDVSRLEDGTMPLSKAICDVAHTARQVAAALAGPDPSRLIEVAVDAEMTAECDATIIHRVLGNMVDNAVKHTPAGGRIEISVRSVPFGVRVAVADEGPGIPAEARRRIFEKFGTVDNRQEGPRHSSALGLAFCRLAIEAHGGTIGVEDGHPAGSVFWFALPR
jgi:two-component system sensor histidine kinase/response regulator